jgi:hypothetical protein
MPVLELIGYLHGLGFSGLPRMVTYADGTARPHESPKSSPKTYEA